MDQFQWRNMVRDGVEFYSIVFGGGIAFMRDGAVCEAERYMHATYELAGGEKPKKRKTASWLVERGGGSV